MKSFLFAILFLMAGLACSAEHLKGGFFTYEYLGKGILDTTKLRYKVRLTVYMVCQPTDNQENSAVYFSFFDVYSRTLVHNQQATKIQTYDLGRGDNPCINGETTGCIYKILVYEINEVELPANASGYIISYQRCCRILNIVNLTDPSNSYGTTYTTTIPPIISGINSSPSFLVNDTAVICAGNYFELPFYASDADTADVLEFSFCEALIGGTRGSPQPGSSVPPPYSSVPYANGFSGSAPLGNNVTIDPKTGMISGIAPGFTGEYVVTVCITEYRNGEPLSSTRKELHVYVGNCNSADASLPVSYSKCESFTYNFSNNVPPNPAIQNYYWEFGDGTTSTAMAPTHTYADTGTYTLKLVVNRNGNCSDSALSTVRVYPGFEPGFRYNGVCVTKPTQFIDSTVSVYGIINKWSWDFGDITTGLDASTNQNPTYTYQQTGSKQVRLIAGDSKGCSDTVYRTVDILDKPPIDVAFADTLICRGDTMQIKAIGFGSFSWKPTTNISDPTIADPLVYPIVTTKYIVELNQYGCLNYDTVQIRVVNFVTLEAMRDTVICLTDSAMLGATTNGLRFVWTPPENMNDPTLLRPKVKPTGTTDFEITAHIGHCNTTDQVRVTTVPYPKSNAGPDTTICFDSPAQLNASIDAKDFTWFPSHSLINSHTLSPIARPRVTTRYTLTVTDNRGCPKPVTDTVIVTVLPRIRAFLGGDTSVIARQPLQLHAYGGVRYEWWPSTGLNDTDIPDPVANYDGSFERIQYKVYVYNDQDCVDSAFITVRIFNTHPSIFVPTAFTPNGDGLNDVARPIAAGIEKIEFFRVYNRWGQLVFETTTNGEGWDGRIKGRPQDTDVFVWLVKAVDYKGKPYFAKGTVTLIR